jgi:hypothetical protein
MKTARERLMDYVRVCDELELVDELITAKVKDCNKNKYCGKYDNSIMMNDIQVIDIHSKPNQALLIPALCKGTIDVLIDLGYTVHENHPLHYITISWGNDTSRGDKFYIHNRSNKKPKYGMLQIEQFLRS